MNDSAAHPAPTQPPLKPLRSDAEAVNALAEMIGREAARRFLAGKPAAANQQAPDAREGAR